VPRRAGLWPRATWQRAPAGLEFESESGVGRETAPTSGAHRSAAEREEGAGARADWAARRKMGRCDGWRAARGRGKREGEERGKGKEAMGRAARGKGEKEKGEEGRWPAGLGPKERREREKREKQNKCF
jgi:hypothetical protein